MVSLNSPIGFGATKQLKNPVDRRIRQTLMKLTPQIISQVTKHRTYPPLTKFIEFRFSCLHLRRRSRRLLRLRLMITHSILLFCRHTAHKILYKRTP